MNRQKKKRLFVRTLVMALFMALFTQALQAQTTTIFMRDGSTTVTRSMGNIEFYDSHGPAHTPECWNYWYQHNEDFTYVFKPQTAGDKIKVTFNSFECYNNDVSIGNWALRLNDDFLYVYEGNGVNADKLIAAFTGNSKQTFTIMTDGAVTFRFVSNARYREEGWFANVTLDQGAMAPQAPFIVRSTCDDAAELLATTLNAQIYYTTDGSNPTTSNTAQLYTGEIEFPASGSLTVKAASKLAEGDAWSEVVEHTFTDDDRVPVPDEPTITRTEGTNTIVMTPATVPSSVNETYVVRYTYTTNGTEPAEPDLTNSTLYTDPITCTTPNTWYKAKTFGLSCSNWVSTTSASLQVTSIYCPTPVISFGDDMFITASEGGVTYAILYTTDGTEPSLSPDNGTQSATTVSLAGLEYGTTVKALAFKMNDGVIDTQYQPSAVVSAIYVPTDANGNTQNGTYGNIVLLDDREDHSWAYYSDDTQPIHKLNPADIKITYSGNGTGNMTANTNTDQHPTAFPENATNVHVNIDATENQFVYLKTLENAEDDGTGNYPYTMIPNPFQVRPIHQSSKGGEATGTDGNDVAFKAIDPLRNGAQAEEMTPRRANETMNAPYGNTPDRGNRDTKTDQLTYNGIGVTGTTYTSWTGKTFTSDAVYAGNSAGSYSSIQLRSSNSNSGIVTTTSGGTVSTITVTWNSNTQTGRTLNIYGKNTAYSSAEDLYSTTSSTQGTSLGTIVYDGTNTNGTLTVSGSYAYVGIRSDNGALYCTEIDIEWTTESGGGSGGGSDCDTENFSGYTATNYNATTYYRPTDWVYANSGSYAPRVSSNDALSSNYSITGMSNQGNFLYMVGSGNYAVMPRTENLASVNFKYAYESGSYGTLQVGYVTNTSNISSTFTQFTDITTSGNSGDLTTVNLTATDIATLNNNSNARLAFYWNYSSYYGVGIDDIEVCTASSTPSISVSPATANVITGNQTTLTATTANDNNATVTWTSSNTSVATVVTNSKATSTATVTGVAAGIATITATITVDGTTYSATSTITVEDPSYCIPAPTNIDGSGMHPVVFGSGSEIVNNTSYPSSSYYGDYSSQIGAYQQGATASVEMSFYTYVSSYYSYDYGVVIWVDWDNDYEFEDTEVVYTGTSTTPSSSTSPGTLTATFTVPSNQAVGYYRMRIGAADSYFDSYINGTTSANHDPCYSGSAYAVFHDYTLHVIAAVEPPADPVIAVASGTYTEAFSTAITCTTSGAVIYYTTDGTNPSASNGVQINSGDEVSITGSCTLKAVAVKDGATSNIASATYLISASGGGSYACEDFESYASLANSSYNTAGSLPTGWTWSYGGDYYFSQYAPHLYNDNGNYARDGVGIIMTAGTDSSYGSSYYLISNINLEEGATVTFNTWVESIYSGTMTYGYVANGYYTPLGTATTASYSGATNADGVTSFVVSNEANGYPLAWKWSLSSSWYRAVIDNVCQQATGAPQAPVFSLAGGEYTGTQTVTITYPGSDATGVTMYYTTDGSTPSASSTPIASGSTVTISSTTTLQAVAINQYGSSSVTSATYTISAGASSAADYRGFYAWRVERLSSGLTITDASNNTYGVGSVIYPDQEILFVTDNEDGNEVEFVALWAKAYVNSSSYYYSNGTGSYANYKNAYERNFKTNVTSLSTYNYPVTITTLNPDGTGTVGTVSRSSYYSCSNDVKLENMYLQMSSYYIDANRYNLTIGRGVQYNADNSTNVASAVYGYYSTSSGTVTFGQDFTVRIESGRYPKAYLFYTSNSSYLRTSESYTWNMVVGSDYDRATNADTKLYITGATEVGYYFNSVSASAKIGFKAISGTFGASTSDTEFYMGFENPNSSYACATPRTLEVLGGKFLGGLAGGIEEPTNVTSSTNILTMRIKGGSFSQYVYGSGQYSAAYGARRTIITGGTFNCWIAAGCYGTSSSGGATKGDIYLYFGGKATQTNTDGIFGAGYGSSATSNDSYTVNQSYVVVADEAQTAGSVFGGGNNGYCEGATEVYVKGKGTKLSIAGSVFGGANKARSLGTTTVTMDDGVVTESIYAGANTSGTVSGKGTVNFNGGTVENVYGGGKGSGTNMSEGTEVNVNDGTITNNVYGGGEEGTVSGATNVSISGGTVTDVYGAGKGGTTTALVSGTTQVTVNGGIVNGAVYGGGQAGNVECSSSGSTTTQEMTVGTVSSSNTATAYGPVYNYYNFGLYQTVYLKSVLTAGTITSISYSYAYNTAMTKKTNVTIYMGTTSSETLSSFMSTANMTKVYSGTLNCSSGWNEFTLSTPFVYNGTDNLVVMVYDNSNGYDGSSYVFNYDNRTNATYRAYTDNQGYISVTDSGTPSINSNVSTSNVSYYPVTRFKIATTSTSPDDSSSETLASTVTVSGGEVKGDVFGGGKMGTTNGGTVVNVNGGILRQNVFGGAYGEHGTVFVGGPKTVNMMGGRVYGSVYGGSRNANDGNSLGLMASSFDTSEETATTSVTNITGGQIDQHVYAAGYYGNTFGSVYAFIGLAAVQNAPNKSPNTGAANLEFTKSKLLIDGTVWAGGDWGVFTGTFGAPTVTGNSNIYIDGEGYSTDGSDPSVNNYMNIAGSILGSGTSCDAGKGERLLLVRNYGADVTNTGSDADVNPYSHATRQSTSVQRFHNVVFDNTHMGFIGQGKINSLNNTERYAFYEIDENLRVANGSTLVMNAPSTQIESLHSVTCDDTYADTPTYAVVGYDGLGSTGSDTDNKIRVNGGSYIEVRHFADPDNPVSGEKSYGELSGFFHIMTSNDSDDATCAYARPKQSQETGNIIPNDEDNPNDGGFVAYSTRFNQYTADGALVEAGEQVQLRYENHTPDMSKDNSEYFRIWRYGGNHHYLEGILNAEATTGGTDYQTVTITVQLPAWTGTGSYYRFDRTGTEGAYNTLIDYGTDVLTYNAACYANPTTGNNWMYFDYDSDAQVTGVGTSNSTIATTLSGGIDDNPNLNFGLVITPGQAMSGDTYIINGDADEFLANQEQPFPCTDNTKVPTVTFTLTYSNSLTANMTWDPILIPLVQCDGAGNITDYVTVALTINTSTEITSGFTTQIYARMNGGTNIREMATVNLVLPTFTVAESGEMSQFTLVKAEFTADEALNPNTGAIDNSYTVTYDSKNASNFGYNNFGLTVSAVANPDNTDDWRFVTGEQDGSPGNSTALNYNIGQAGGRSSLSFGVTLYYNSNVSVTEQTHMGDVTFTIGFTNFDGGSDDNHYSEFTVTVEVYRIGPGKNYYVDGINGIDASDTNRGKYPDKPAKTVNYILNRLGYLPGDHIFVVDNLPITKATTWDGSAFQNDVNIFRYPGGHALSGETQDFDNSPYLGTLVDVSKTLTIKGVTIDGMYAEAVASDHNESLYPSECDFDGEANAPLIAISDGGRVNLTSVTTLQNNYNGDNAFHGGAVNVAYGGILAMNMASTITGNINENGGAVYMDGGMIVADSIYVFDNYQTTAKAKQNNVYLATKGEGNFRVVQVGTSANDAYDALQVATNTDQVTKIGVTKDDWTNTYEGYMPVVYAESGSESLLNDPYDNQELIVHDGNIYRLERYVTNLHSDSPLYLYWLGTWVTAVTSEPEGFSASDIDTPEELAWAISIVNGENGQTPAPNTTFILTDDINMIANIWVPIGNETAMYEGNFQGNGHVVSGLQSPLNRSNMGMFGVTNGAIIQDMVVNAEFNSTASNMGAVIGTMTNGTLYNVEGSGTLTNNYANGNTGGLVGVINEDSGDAVVHSSFSAATITGGKNIGGLTVTNNGDIYNSYSNTVMSGATNMAGLAVTNNGTIENCYVILNDNDNDIPAFAATNEGAINYCYAPTDATTTVGEGNGTQTGNGTYAAVADRKAYGYMYYDNAVTPTNDYVANTVTYAGGKIATWPGLLSTLNQWVEAKSTVANPYTNWLRPTSADINGDLPVLTFPKDNCLGTVSGRALRYSAFSDRNNGLDDLLDKFDDNTGYLFLYGNATEVENVPSDNVNVFINEDAVLLQADGADDFINATVGVTFDNSSKSATDYWGNTLSYDWHLMSTPLSDAPMGITYTDQQSNWWVEEDEGQVEEVDGGYLPDDIDGRDGVQWDFYTYYEPEYHWINFKRNSLSHYHYDEPHAAIDYNNETDLVAGKGYMAAIDQDSYLSNTGTLNKGGVNITLTHTAGDDTDPSRDYGWNLVGNPYQAYLDLQQLGYTAYGYDADQGVYAPYVAEASENPCILSRYIHPHQAFFVYTENSTTLSFTKAMATDKSTETSFFRGSDKLNYPVVNLFAENARGNRDLTIVEFNRPATGGATKVDGLRNANFKIAAHFGGESYGLLFTPEGTERVPVHFQTLEDGTYTIRWSMYNGDFTSLFLVDNKNGVRTDMLHNDHYTFNASVNDYASRFYITCRATGVDETVSGEGDEFAFYDGNEWVINGQGYLQLIDVTGRVLEAHQLSGEQSRVHLDHYAAGVYMLRLGSATQKIVIR